MEENQSESTRLNKFISETGFCSRREADKLIADGHVQLNGRTAVLGDRASVQDEVLVRGKQIRATNKDKAVYIAFHKPVGITCTTERHIPGNIIDYIKHPERVFPIGRLDKPSEGLIFLTSNGDIVNKILRAGNRHEKEYEVAVDRPIAPEFLHKMQNGVPILGTITQKCVVRKKSKYIFTIILTQGLNRQIRRMCSYLGYSVTRLKRVRIMNVTLDGLAAGKWRNLTEQEMTIIHGLVADSTKTEEASRLNHLSAEEDYN
ncbi:23S rRNA pseudouridine(2604) synthase RluF [Arundinibacter roseus]|uniref:Pseudouridine synthase n=1 Tax=Arundinibacter roseus TaxID=2070510 RepID=A0A4R4KJS1_9BACT|nr:23S rRNA pseudouridine(2604) synthase RluF [Arundinibacter roseus]TDB66849.1 23S rRNA pseudouridine(2604) synthase RluF [Arundinibacter roseus]